MYEVSTGSGSDRVSINAAIEFASRMTRSLPLPVLTSLRIDLMPRAQKASANERIIRRFWKSAKFTGPRVRNSTSTFLLGIRSK